MTLLVGYLQMSQRRTSTRKLKLGNVKEMETLLLQLNERHKRLLEVNNKINATRTEIFNFHDIEEANLGINFLAIQNKLKEYYKKEIDKY